MKTTTETFKALSNLRLFPTDLTKIIDAYVARYDIQLAKKLYEEASAGDEPDGCYSGFVFGWPNFCVKVDVYLFRIFALALHALYAEKDFDSKFFKETYGDSFNSDGDLFPDALKMLEIILVGVFSSQDHSNLITYINRSKESPNRSGPKWEKFKNIVWSSLSLIFNVVTINSKFMQLMHQDNLKKGCNPSDKDLNISETLDYFLESKISYPRTRYISFFNGNFGNKHHIFALTDHESKKLKGICDSYCYNHKDVSILKLSIRSTLNQLLYVNIPGFQSDFPKTTGAGIALTALIQSIENSDSSGKIIALIESSSNDPDLQCQSFHSALKEIKEFFSDLPAIEDYRFGI